MLLRKLFRWVPRGALGDALATLQRGDFESAATRFEAILSAADEPPPDVVTSACETWVQVAAARTAAGDRAGCVQALERAVALRPGYADLHLQLGRAHAGLDQLQRARAAFERALEINPRYLEARLALARLLMQLEDVDGARRLLQDAARHATGAAAPALHALLEADPQGGLQAPEPRLEALLQAVDAAAAPPLAAGLDAARAALRAGDNRGAIAALKRLLEVHAAYPDLHNLLGVAYDNEEMTDDAIEEFERALRLHPGYLDARLHLGMALFDRGRDLEAERHLRCVLAEQPANQLAQTVLQQIATRSAAR